MKTTNLFANPRHGVLLQAESPAEASLASLQTWLQTERSNIAALLAQHGVILCRGFAIENSQDFRACVDALGDAQGSYIGGNSPRTAVGDGVFTSTEFAANAEITIHNEMSYARDWPQRLFFYCPTPAATGGQTTLADGRDILADLPSELIAKYRSKRLRYIRNFSPIAGLGRSWQETYQTTDRQEVEQRIRATGSEFSWLSGDTLRVWTDCDALQRHPASNDEVWFNQAEQWHPSAQPADLREVLEMTLGADRLPHDCQFADGTPLDEAELALIRQTLQKNYLLFDWQKNDFLIVDNINFLHGRQPFTGERRVLVALA